MTADEINTAAIDATLEWVRGYCRHRFNEGASREQINMELKEQLPAINAWSRRHRTILRMMLADPPTNELQ